MSPASTRNQLISVDLQQLTPYTLLLKKIYLPTPVLNKNSYCFYKCSVQLEAAMSESSLREVTHLLLAWRHGKKEALDKLIPVVYGKLGRLAHSYMRDERKGHILQTTALVNEACLRLLDWGRVEWQNRAHFMAISDQMMRCDWKLARAWLARELKKSNNEQGRLGY